MNAFNTETISALVVDDHPFVLQAASLLLRNLGVGAISMARNAREARKELSGGSDRFDLILCDLHMPEEDGLEFLRWLAQQESSPAVVLMSGEDRQVLSAARRLGEARNLNILGIVEKPLSTSVLRELIARLWLPSNASSETIRSRKLTVDEIHEGLENEWFEAWFQPQIDTRTGEVRGMEALLRLRHPDFGIIGPDAFIATAEASGQIEALTEFVVEKSVRTCADWKTCGFDVAVSINLSARNLVDFAFPDRLLSTCRRHAVEPRDVVLELTESSLAGDQNRLLDIVARLRLKKFRLSIDDFGTGFSSLGQLKGLPFHELKVDKGFVLDAPDDARSRSILESSVRLARDLNLTVVAEGVETSAHLELVAALGCDSAQGFLFARPMPPTDAIEWLSNFHSEFDGSARVA